MSTLELRDVDITYGKGRSALTAVRDASIVVPDGSTLGLVGESGSGKSTIAKAVVGLAPVTAGSVLLDGEDITHARGEVLQRLRSRVQLVFQDPYASLNPRMTVGELIGEAITLHHDVSRRERDDEIIRLLGLVAMDADAAERYPHQFSGGQRQRIAVARALAVQPDLIIADEITSSLDVSVQAAVLNLIRGIQREVDLSMLFISHNLSVVRYVSDRIAVMHLGQIVEVADREALFARPQHPYTRTLLDSIPTLSQREEGRAGRVRVKGDVPDPHDPPPGCRFHTRCPIGPNAFPERTVCAEVDPHTVAADNPHRAACHFPLGTQPADVLAGAAEE